MYGAPSNVNQEEVIPHEIVSKPGKTVGVDKFTLNNSHFLCSVIAAAKSARVKKAEGYQHNNS